MKITKDEIKSKVDGLFDMNLAGKAAKVVEKVVNVGIDSHLEACYVPARGDRFVASKGRLACLVSGESLAVLIRRLTEITSTEQDGDDADEGWSLASDILGSLGFDVETACFDVV